MTEHWQSQTPSIRLVEKIFSTLGAGLLTKGAFKNMSAGSADADGCILCKQAVGELFHDADSARKRAAVRFAVLDDGAKLTHDDCFVVRPADEGRGRLRREAVVDLLRRAEPIQQ